MIRLKIFKHSAQEAFCRWFSDLSAKGIFIQTIGSIRHTFRSGTPHPYSYRFEPIPDGGKGRLLSARELEDYHAACAESGMYFVTRKDNFELFAFEPGTQVQLFSTEQERLDLIYSLYKKDIWQYILTLLIFLVLDIFYLLRSPQSLFPTPQWTWLMIINMSFVIIVYGIHLINFYRFQRAYKKHLPIPKGLSISAYTAMTWVWFLLLIIMLNLFLSGLNLSGFSSSDFFLALAAVFIPPALAMVLVTVYMSPQLERKFTWPKLILLILSMALAVVIAAIPGILYVNSDLNSYVITKQGIYPDPLLGQKLIDKYKVVYPLKLDQREASYNLIQKEPLVEFNYTVQIEKTIWETTFKKLASAEESSFWENLQSGRSSLSPSDRQPLPKLTPLSAREWGVDRAAWDPLTNRLFLQKSSSFWIIRSPQVLENQVRIMHDLELDR